MEAWLHRRCQRQLQKLTRVSMSLDAIRAELPGTPIRNMDFEICVDRVNRMMDQLNAEIGMERAA